MAKSCGIHHLDTGLQILSVPESICRFLELISCEASLEVAQQKH